MDETLWQVLVTLLFLDGRSVYVPSNHHTTLIMTNILSKCIVWFTVYTILQENRVQPWFHLSCPCDIPLHSPKLKVFQIHIVFNPIKILYPTMWTFDTEYCGMVNSVHPQYFSQCFKCGILWPIVFPQYMSWKDIVQLRILQATRQLWMPILMGPPQFLSTMPMRKDSVTTLTFESKVGKSWSFYKLVGIRSSFECAFFVHD